MPASSAPSSQPGGIFVMVEPAKHELFVGESVPVVIRVGAEDDVIASLDGPPVLQGDSFTLEPLSSEPEVEQRIVNGKPCTLMEWHSRLAAIKPGTQSLTIAASLTVRVPTARRPEPQFVDEATADDAYQVAASGGLLQTTVAEPRVVSSDSASFQVLPLPEADQPPGFSGAVGSFDISSDLPERRAVVGEPLTLRLRVHGDGNFDRVLSPMLAAAKGWKVYRSTVSNTRTASMQNRGEKLFEQSVVATTPGRHQLPGLEFSYFDPVARHYAVARTPALDVDVVPNAITWPAEGTEKTQIAQHAGFRVDHADIGSDVRSLVPLYLQPRLFSVAAIMAFGFAGFWLERRRQRRPQANSRMQPPAHHVLLQMQQAEASGDRVAFFRLARQLLTYCEGRQMDAELDHILSLIEEAFYADEVPASCDLQRWRKALECRMQRLSLDA